MNDNKTYFPSILIELAEKENKLELSIFPVIEASDTSVNVLDIAQNKELLVPCIKTITASLSALIRQHEVAFEAPGEAMEVVTTSLIENFANSDFTVIWNEEPKGTNNEPKKGEE